MKAVLTIECKINLRLDENIFLNDITGKRTGSGKKGDPFRYEKNALLLYPPIYGESNRASFDEDNLTKLQGNFSTGDFQKNEPSGRAFNREFPPQKRAEEDPSKGGLYEVMDDGQLTY